MDEQEPRKQTHELQRLFRVFSPFLLILVSVLIVNIWFAGEVKYQPPASALTNASPVIKVTERGIEESMLEMSVATAIPYQPLQETPSPTSTSAVVELSASEVATLIGPPVGSRFSADVPITFYWHGTTPLSEDQYFGLYLLSNGSEMLISTLDEPNLGTGYQSRFDPQAVEVDEGQYAWAVRLLHAGDNNTLGESERRPIIFTGVGE